MLGYAQSTVSLIVLRASPEVNTWIPYWLCAVLKGCQKTFRLDMDPLQVLSEACFLPDWDLRAGGGVRVV